MSCNCRGGPFCCMKVQYDTNPFPNFDEYYKPKVDYTKAREALDKARAKRKKNIKHVAE